MEEDEEIKKKINKDKNYEEFSIDDLLEEIKNLKKELKFLENLLKNKKSSQNTLIHSRCQIRKSNTRSIRCYNSICVNSDERRA